jgi:N12 class adenine-specific DNA methylase
MSDGKAREGRVSPVDLTAAEIDARLGSTWIPANDLALFVEELLGERAITINHVPQLGLWVVQAGWNAKSSVANTTEFGTDRRSALELIEDAMNLRTPTVYDRDEQNDRDVVNSPATEAARDKQEKLKERFKAWLWQDDDRRERQVWWVGTVFGGRTGESEQVNQILDSIRIRSHTSTNPPPAETSPATASAARE